MKTKQITKSALFLVLFFLSSNIIPAIPIFGIPFTLQTLVISLIPFYFSYKEIIIWYLALLFITLIGIPMMSGFSSGLTCLIGPSAGFIYGWLIKMIVIKKALQYNNKYILFIIMLISSLIDLMLGGIYLALFTNIDILISTKTMIVTFMPLEIVKTILTLVVVARVPKSLQDGKLIYE
ncbi:MAG: biotin transporter BioY [Bacilli bacterium]|jgi:biotin transport system substrate-specific component|nr:biotin transporter BioY [Bacilli bacterium]